MEKETDLPNWNKHPGVNLPKVNSRGNAVTGWLEHAGIEITLKVKKPEDWVKFKKYYTFNSKKLWSDLLWFMEVGFQRGIPKTRKHKGQDTIDSIKIFSAVVYRFCKHMKEVKQCPPLLKPLQNKALDCKDLTASLMDAVFMDYFKKSRFSHHGDKKNWYRVKINRFYDRREGISTDNFYETYVKGGNKLIRNTDPILLMMLIYQINSILCWLPLSSNILKISYNKNAYKLLMAISEALIPHKNSTDIKISALREIDLKDIEFIKRILIRIYPTLPMPD